MQEVVNYFNQMAQLEVQGVPIQWQGVARQMALMCAEMLKAAQAAQPDAPAPLPEPPI